MRPAVERLALDGPAGTIEAALSGAADATHTAVICHPHPLYGGTMDNKVVTTLARTFEQLGARALRFNFRGVGASAGDFGHARGETEDLHAVVHWARERFAGSTLWLAGFSFGAYVALRAAHALQPARLVTVAPAVHLYDSSEIASPGCPWLFVQGEADEVVPNEASRAWLASLATPPDARWLPDTGHFFHQRLPDLQAVVREWMAG
jgi:hypothetical protein